MRPLGLTLKPLGLTSFGSPTLKVRGLATFGRLLWNHCLTKMWALFWRHWASPVLGALLWNHCLANGVSLILKPLDLTSFGSLIPKPLPHEWCESNFEATEPYKFGEPYSETTASRMIWALFWSHRVSRMRRALLWSVCEITSFATLYLCMLRAVRSVNPYHFLWSLMHMTMRRWSVWRTVKSNLNIKSTIFRVLRRAIWRQP
jgi:hypothetical protein